MGKLDDALAAWRAVPRYQRHALVGLVRGEEIAAQQLGFAETAAMYRAALALLEAAAEEGEP